MNRSASHRLLAALLLRAVQDAQDADPELAVEARRWLVGEGLVWAETLDLDRARVIEWVEGLPALPFEQLMLPL